MDERVELINKVSYDILNKYNAPIVRLVKKEVEEYSKLFENVIKNYYELETMGEECPLFQLCYYTRVGKDNFGMEEEEFNQKIETLRIKTNKMFDVEMDC